MIIRFYFYPIKKRKLLSVIHAEICPRLRNRDQLSWTQTVSAPRSSSCSWPAAVEMRLFNRQIKFMASFSTSRLPSAFRRRNRIPPSPQRGPVSSQSLPFSHFRRSPSSSGPAVIPLSLTLTRLASSRILLAPPLSLLLSSQLVPLFQSFRSSFKPGPRGQEFGLVFQSSLLSLLW